MVTGRRCWVEGRVQGVFFRASVRERALELGLAGSAANLPDGRVEVEVHGDAQAVERLCAWLWEGPPAARVTDVSCEPLEYRALEGFVCR